MKATIVDPIPLMRVRFNGNEVDEEVEVKPLCGEEIHATFTLSSEGRVRRNVSRVATH